MINPSLFIGLRVRLTAFMPEDASVAARWYEDAEFARMFDASPAAPRSPQRLARWLSYDDRQPSDSYAFAIR
ncbi:GNAT family N-acetyltransferase, partial [Anaerolineae bacterium CFX9]|nr:GNAT family N-acetyltransferase [Anaerolineae bacterium CFX9]